MNGETTRNLGPETSSSDLALALNAFISLDGVTVTRYDLINNGVMFLVTFTPKLGNYPLIIMNDDKLTATSLNTATSIYQIGDGIAGSFIIFTNTLSKETVSSVPLPLNATSYEVKLAVESLNPIYKPVIVTRKPDPVLFNAYTWSVTFPYHAGDVVPLDVNNAGLLGYAASVEVVTVQDGRIPTQMRVTTTASSTLSGYFELTLEGQTTIPIAHNATELDMKGALEGLPG